MSEKKASEEEVIKYYDEYTARQKRIGVNDRHIKILEGLKKFGLQKNGKVLEVGCGIGTASKLIGTYLNEGELLAIDISAKSIEEAKELWPDLKNIDFQASSVLDFEIQDSFDVIVFPDVLEHIPKEKHESIFNKSATLLKENGFILINIPDPIYLDHLREKHPERLQIIDQSLYLDHFVDALKNSGLYITFLESYSIWKKPLEYQTIVLKKESSLSKIERIENKPSLSEKFGQKLKSLFKNE